MPITSTIARHFAWRCILISIGSLVFGLWGVYDYVWSIPARERHVERGEVCRLVRSALEPGRWSEHADEARRALDEQIQRFRDQHFAAVEAQMARIDEFDPAALEEAEAEFHAAVESIRERNEEEWFLTLMLFDQALAAGEPRTTPLTGVHLLAYEVADLGAQAVANVKPPRVYDRPIQWAFILCLPFFPLYLWFYVETSRRRYRLDEVGTLHFSEPTRSGSWTADEIADIDMSRWMKKSIAYVVHANGTRLKLDDYKHRNLHLIVGAIAARLRPDEWTAEAKPVKPREPAMEAESEAAEAV